MKGCVKVFGAVTAILWILCCVTGIILLTAGDGGYLADRMLKNAPPEVTGLPETEYPGIGEMTAGYLTGRTDRFQYSVTRTDGRTVACFHDYEEAHMADCRALIALDRTVLAVSGGLLILLTAVFFRRRTEAAFCRGMLGGLRTILSAAAGLTIWALADFNGFFVTFHRIAFTNDGWLLNPATDLLIRLMPEQFFIDLGIRGMIPAAAVMIMTGVAARIGIRRGRRYSATENTETGS